MTLPQKIREAMDGLRRDVWCDDDADGPLTPRWSERLQGADGLKAEQANLEEAKAAYPPTALQERKDIDFWISELEFQRLWILAASQAGATGQEDLAGRLARVYRLLYGGELPRHRGRTSNY